MSYVQSSEGCFQVAYLLGLWSRSCGVVNVRFRYGYILFTFTFTLLSND